MDEPTSALDPISTLRVEELVQELKENYSIIMVTHNMQQAARVSDKTAFFLMVMLTNTTTLIKSSLILLINKQKTTSQDVLLISVMMTIIRHKYEGQLGELIISVTLVSCLLISNMH